MPNTAGDTHVPNSLVSSTRISSLECPSSNPSSEDPARLDDDPDPKTQTGTTGKGYYGTNIGISTAGGRHHGLAEQQRRRRRPVRSRDRLCRGERRRSDPATASL